MLNEHEVTKLYYSIGEIATELGVATSAIRFWLEAFSLDVRKNSRGNRKFTAQDVEKVKRIYQLVKVEGYTLAGAKRQLQQG